MASMGVFTAGGTPIDEQVPLQPVGVSCRRGSSWSDLVYYRWKKEGDRGDKAACRAGCASILGLLRPREKGSCSFFEVLGTIGSGSQWLNKTKREQNIIHPALLWGRSGAVTVSLISAKVSHRWHSWTTNVDIVCPRACAGTFVALKARSVAVRSSCISFRLFF